MNMRTASNRMKKRKIFAPIFKKPPMPQATVDPVVLAAAIVLLS